MKMWISWRGLLLLALCCLGLLSACSSGPQASQKPTPTPRPTATAATSGSGAQLLAQAGQMLTSAHTLQGQFNATVSGQVVNGEIDSEVWRQDPNKSRTLVTNSTVSQFATGTLIVSDGQHIWQYNPTQKVVYSGTVATSAATDTPASGTTQDNVQQLLLGAVQAVFTHSTATLLSSNKTLNGRPVYIIQVASAQSQSTPTTGGLSFNYTGTVSLDQQTKLPLALNLSIPGFADVQIAIPTLQLNQPLNPNLFTFTPPPGSKVEPFPTNLGQGNSSLTLQQAEQQAGYHLLSIPAAQSAYHLQSIDALGAPGSSIYALTYTFNGQTFTISEGKALANLPVSGQHLTLRGTSATLSTAGSNRTLTWTESGVGIQISGPLSQAQIVAIAQILS